VIRTLAITCLLARAAGAAPCEDPVLDPVTTPIRDAAIDQQRTACLRNEMAIHLGGRALVDNPGFHGVLSGDLRGSGRLVLRPRFELDVDVQLVDATFVQNAVNKATRVAAGPITVGAAFAAASTEDMALALVGSVELRGTRTGDDTVRTSGELTAVATGVLAARTLMHGRFGGVWMLAASTAGDSERVAFRAGVDVAHRLARPLSVLLGAEAQTGWYGGGLDHVSLRAGVQLHVRRGWRGAIGIAAPVGGEERTNVVLDLAVVHAL